MEKSKEYTTGIIIITNLARKLNPDIGLYLEHFHIENFGFIVRLSNGGIKISKDLAHYCEMLPDGIANDRIKLVAESFWKN